MYVLVSGQNVIKYPYTFFDLMKDNPNTSFPLEATDELLAEWGVFTVTPTEKPQVTVNETGIEDTPILDNNTSKWVQTWIVKQATSEEVLDRVLKKTSEIRKIRDDLLSGSDWTQVSDSPVNKEEWSLYRQALRDIPTQEGFPFNVVWPLRP